MLNKIIPRMDETYDKSSSTMALLCSPQTLVTNTKFQAALTRARDMYTFRMLTISEANLYSGQGKTFWDEIHILRNKLFQPLFNSGHRYEPLFYATMAIMPNTLVKALSDLTHVN